MNKELHLDNLLEKTTEEKDRIEELYEGLLFIKKGFFYLGKRLTNLVYKRIKNNLEKDSFFYE